MFAEKDLNLICVTSPCDTYAIFIDTISGKIPQNLVYYNDIVLTFIKNWFNKLKP